MADENEIEIVRQAGLGPIVACAAMVAEAMDNDMNGEGGRASTCMCCTVLRCACVWCIRLW